MQRALEDIPGIVRAHKKQRVPVVLTPQEVERVRARGSDIRTVQKQLGHADVRTTEIYTHVRKRGARAVLSPLGAALYAADDGSGYARAVSGPSTKR